MNLIFNILLNLLRQKIAGKDDQCLPDVALEKKPVKELHRLNNDVIFFYHQSIYICQTAHSIFLLRRTQCNCVIHMVSGTNRIFVFQTIQRRVVGAMEKCRPLLFHAAS